MGGLFATYVLFTKPTLFDNYIISSPSIWWDKDIILKQEERYWSVTKDLKAKAYFSLANEKDLAKRTVKFVDKLKAREYKGLEIKLEAFPTDTHQTVVPKALEKGLGFIFSKD
jgi:hypothetical protein